MKQKLLFIGIGLIILIGCQVNSDKNSTLKFKAKELYSNAQIKMMEKEHDLAIALLRQSLETGLERPMQIVTDSNSPRRIHPYYLTRGKK